MRGSPLLRALACWLVLLGLWPVVARVTDGVRQHAGGGLAGVELKESPEPVERPGGVSCRLEMRFTAPCRGLVVRHLGAEVLAVEDAVGFLEREVHLEVPPEGVDLVFRWDWGQAPDSPSGGGGVEHAARIRLRMPDGRMEERTVWGGGAVEEVLGFGGKGA